MSFTAAIRRTRADLRVIDTGAACAPSEERVDWNQFSGYEVVSTAFAETATSCAFAIFEESAPCPTGKVVLGGGVLARFVDVAGVAHPAQLDSSWPSTSDTWDVRLSRSDGNFFAVGESVRGTVYAICPHAS
jgi:hypothetical protein